MSTEISKQTSTPTTARRQEYLRPHYTVGGTDQAYEVDVFLPGVARDQASITLENNTLLVEAHRTPHAAEGWRPIHQEIPTADYRLRLQLNVRVDENQITANSHDGVLKILLPVAEEAKPRSIQIQ